MPRQRWRNVGSMRSGKKVETTALSITSNTLIVIFYGGGYLTLPLARSSEVIKGHERSSPGKFKN